MNYENSMTEPEILCQKLTDDFGDAFIKKQFTVYFQPKFDIRSDEPQIAGADAIAYWNHPEYGMIGPGAFIPALEKNGMIGILDRFVWSETARHISDWKKRFGLSVPVSVRVSGFDFYEPDLSDTLKEIIKENGLGQGDLILDISESACMNDPERIVKKLKELKEIGFRTEMDDFGSGSSSLSLLSNLPFESFRFDMNFIKNEFKDRKYTRLLDAMIGVASAFGVSAAAKGVKTAEQVFTLKMKGCALVCGDYFSPPLPAEEFVKSAVEMKQSSEKHAMSKSKPGRYGFTYNALHDQLTGLYNYTGFEILFRDSDMEHIAVLIIDVNDYEIIKNKNGKDRANDIAVYTTETLRANFRSADHICRLREDKFCVIMTRVMPSGRSAITAKIKAIEDKLSHPDHGEPFSVSMVIAFYDESVPGCDVFEEAEAALSKYKANGKTGYTVFPASLQE